MYRARFEIELKTHELYLTREKNGMQKGAGIANIFKNLSAATLKRPAYGRLKPLAK